MSCTKKDTFFKKKFICKKIIVFLQQKLNNDRSNYLYSN